MPTITLDSIEGCLLGTALADGSGAILEGMRREDLREEFQSPAAVLNFAWSRKLNYTDDTQMTLVLAKYLTSHSTIESESLMAAFVDAFEAWRGYGRGTRSLVDAYRYQTDWNFLAETIFPGGSHGNGAAMRSAPIGLRFFADHNMIWQQAAASAHPTHRNKLGIEGAQLIALATSLAIELPEVSTGSLAETLQPWCQTTVFTNRIKLLSAIHNIDQIEQLGNGIEAHESVVTALACFAMSPDDYTQAIGLAIWQGGDTDTIAAMTGALCGARLGREGIPKAPIANLEDDAFANQISTLATELYACLDSEV